MRLSRSLEWLSHIKCPAWIIPEVNADDLDTRQHPQEMLPFGRRNHKQHTCHETILLFK